MSKFNKKYRRGRYRGSTEGWPEGMLAGQGKQYNQIGGPQSGTSVINDAEDIWGSDLWGEYRLSDSSWTTSGFNLATWSAIAPSSRVEELGDVVATAGPAIYGSDDGERYFTMVDADDRLGFEQGSAVGPDLQNITIYLVMAPVDNTNKKRVVNNSSPTVQIWAHNVTTKMPGMRWGGSSNEWVPTTSTLTSRDWHIVRYSGRSSDNKKSMRIFGNGVDEEHTDSTKPWGGSAATGWRISASGSVMDGDIAHVILLDAYYDSSDSRDQQTFDYINGWHTFLGF